MIKMHFVNNTYLLMIRLLNPLFNECEKIHIY